MNDNDVIIRAEKLCKTYRLYTKPHYRFLDMFGLLRNATAYSEHMAVKDIDLSINRGEKSLLLGEMAPAKAHS